MIDHRTVLDLAATAIDFALDEAERAVLDAHLAGCSSCRAEAQALRGDAAALAALPAIAPPTWVRRVIGRPRGPRRAALLLAAALLLTATVGVALAVGAALRHQVAPELFRSPSPGPSAGLASARPSAATSPSPSLSPSPTVGPPPVPEATSFPAGAGSAWMGASPDGGTWLLTVHDGGTTADPASKSVIALLDASGRPRTGWPIALTGWRCAEDGPPHALPVAADGSIRLICAEDSLVDGPLRKVGLAFDAVGRALPGWPVELPDVGLTTSAVVVGDELRVVASEIASADGSSAQSAAWWVVGVSATGEVRQGQRYEVADAAGGFDVRLAADGVAYRLAFHDSDPIRTEITAFDLDGVRPGWPVTVDGITSQPVVAPDGLLAVVRLTKPALTSQVLWFTAAGGAPAATSGDLPLDPVGDRTGAGSVLMAPIVGADGAAWVVGAVDSTKPAVAHVVRGSAVVDLYLRELPVQPQGSCDPQDSGCGVWLTVPAIRPDGALFAPESATGGPGLTSSSGGSLVAIAPNGTIPRGWPVFLPDPMAGYWSVFVARNGTVEALEVVPTDAGNEWSFVIRGGNGAVRSTTPIIRP
jgi:hypothetical protein